MKKLLSLLLIICSIGVAYADDKSTVTSLKYVTDELNTRQDKFGANDGKAMTFTNAAGGNLPRDVKESLGTSTSDNGLPTVDAVNTGIATKQDEIGAVNTNTVVTYTGTPGTLGQKGIYQDTGTYASQSDNLIQASTFNAALRNGLENEFVCAGTDDGTANGNCWLWSIDNETDETIEIRGKNLNGGGELENKGYTSVGGTSTSTTFCGTLWKIKVNPGEEYTVSYGNFPDGVSGVFINTWKTDGTWNMRQAISLSESYTYTYTVPAGIGEVNFTLYKTGGITITDNSWLQVERGNVATPYEPYTGETVNVYIPQNQSAQNQ